MFLLSIFIYLLINEVQDMANRSQIWTKQLNNLPKFSIVQIASYISENGRDRAFEKGYKFFTESYVHDVFVCLENNIFNVKGKCWRSQRKNEKPHELCTKINVHNSKIVDGHCTCIAGSGGVCNHVVALLYNVHHWSSTKQTEIPADMSCTSLAQKWHKPRGDKIEPEPVMKLSFAKASTDRQTRKRESVACFLYDARAKRDRKIPSDDQITNIQNKIGQRNSNIPIVYLCEDKQYDIMDTLFGDVPVGSPLSYQLNDYHTSSLAFSAFLPDVVHTVLKENLKFPDLPISNLKLKIFSNLNIIDPHTRAFLNNLEVSDLKSKEIEQSTVDQGQTPLWHDLRCNRLTASNFGNVMNRKSAPSESFIKNLFSAKNLSNVTAIAHGSEKEEIARKAYARKMCKYANHNVTVFRTGLQINTFCPYLGASPDGKVMDRSVYDHFGLLEIKCPYKYRNLTPMEAASYKDFCLENVNGQLHLRKSHDYYYQVTGQMAISGMPWCDFVVFTSKGLFVERIFFDEEVWSVMFPKLTEFYFNYAIPYLKNSQSQNP